MAVDQTLLQEALTETGRRHGPGLFGLVTEGGEVMFEASVGVADLQRPRPIDAADQFRIGSVTKTYVTVLVLQLVADGVLSLSDPVARWLPGAVPRGGHITVEMLLRLRSGLPDYTGQILGDPPDLSVSRRYRSPAQLIAAALTESDGIPPDTRFRYCNTDYILLGLIVEVATGQRVDAQLWQRILRPLALNDTTLPTVDPYLRGAHATGYLRHSDEVPYAEFTTMSPSQSWTAGGMVATAGDLAAFLDGLFDGRLLDPDTLALMTDCTEVLDEYRTRGLGLVRYDFGTGPVAFGHHGGVPGYTTLALRNTAGRCVVLWQNGLDFHDVLTSDAPFIRAALTA